MPTLEMNVKKLILLTLLLSLSTSCTTKSQKVPQTSLPAREKTSASSPQVSSSTPSKSNPETPHGIPAALSQLDPEQLSATLKNPTENKEPSLLLSEASQSPRPSPADRMKPKIKQLETPEVPPPVEPFPSPQPAQPQPAQLQPAQPQPASPSEAAKKEAGTVEDRGVAFNFDNVDIKDFIDTVSELTGQNFILSPGVSGKVSIITTGRIPREDVFNVLESVLEVNNLTVVKSGQFYKVVPIAIARQKTIPVETGKEVKDGDRVVTHIVRLKYISPAEAMNVLGPFISQTSGNLHPYPKANILIITDLASNVRRLLDILEQIDVNIYERLQIEIFYIRNVTLEDLVKELEQILSAIPDGAAAAGQGGMVTKFVPIARYNALMLITSSPKVTQLVREWIKILDQPAKEVARRNYIYYVKHSKAADLAKVLEELYRGKAGERATVTTAPTTTQRREERPTPRSAVQPPGTQPGQPGQPPRTPQPGQPSVPTEGQPSAVREGEVLIVADELTNSLIIRTSPAQYQAIKELLDELDLRPPQVLIETLIVEVSLDKSTLFGIQGTLLGQNQLTIGGETNSFQSQSRTVFPDVTSSNTGFTYVLEAAGRLAAQLRTLATENRVKVLSNPHILVRNNEKATIQVGEEIPILSGVSTVPTTGAEGTVTNQFINSVQYRDIGIILRVTPRINKEGAVVLDIEQEVSNVQSASFGDTRSPSFGKRNSSTSVVAQNGQTLIIGGLIRENRNRNEQGVPGVSRIPLLGRLFKSENASFSKTELLILVTPQVLDTVRDGDKMTYEFSQKIQALQKFFDKSNENDLAKILNFLKLKNETSQTPVQ
ncbi:MAG TPA: type II secretion system secretin GspD [Candidatus Limnocylindrales bacterium]|nr:type II secretion system secretin GspD [Candidatus Limnocylindrales bacterium]